MRQAFELIVSVVLVSALTACEDMTCKKDLDAAKTSAAALQTDLDALKAESTTLKAKVAQADALSAQVQALTQENETLKASAKPAVAPAAVPPVKAEKKK